MSPSKHVLLIAIFIYSFQSVFSQPCVNNEISRKLYLQPSGSCVTPQKIQMPNAQNYQKSATMRTTNINSRLVAYSEYIFDGSQYVIQTGEGEDSGIYVYSGDRGGDLTHTLKYDTCLNFVGSYYNNFILLVQEFDTNNNITLQLQERWDTSTYSWVNYWQFTYLYDTVTNTLLSKLWQIWDISTGQWNINNKDTFFYKVNGMDSIYFTYLWNGSNWISYEEELFFYNSSGNIDTTIDSVWNNLSSVWSPYIMYIYSYDTTANLDTVIRLNYDSCWQNFTRDIYSNYLGGDSTYYIWQIWDSAHSVWNYSGRYITYYDAGNAISQKDQGYDSNSWYNYYNFTYTYNSYNQCTSETVTQWNDTTNSWQAKLNNILYYYYYEDYSNIVNDLTSAQGIIKAYPVPATNRLNIDIDYPRQNIFDIAIYDMSGILNLQWQTPICSQYHTEVPLNNLASGVYIIQIITDKTTLQQQFCVIH